MSANTAQRKQLDEVLSVVHAVANGQFHVAFPGPLVAQLRGKESLSSMLDFPLSSIESSQSEDSSSSIALSSMSSSSVSKTSSLISSIVRVATSSLKERKTQRKAFHDLDNDVDIMRTYDTSIVGRFSCRNQKCRSKGWLSMRTAITIRMYRDERYNARVYHQRCKACSFLSKPILDDSYAERVAYRLKKWCGVELERSTFSGQSKGPHEMKFCEGCKAGHCSEGRGIDGLIDDFSNFSLGGI
jgi:hypothetical protein